MSAIAELLDTIAANPALRVAFGLFGLAASIGAIEWLRARVARDLAGVRRAPLLCRLGLHIWRYELSNPPYAGDARRCRRCPVKENLYRDYFGLTWGRFD